MGRGAVPYFQSSCLDRSAPAAGGIRSRPGLGQLRTPSPLLPPAADLPVADAATRTGWRPAGHPSWPASTSKSGRFILNTRELRSTSSLFDLLSNWIHAGSRRQQLTILFSKETHSAGGDRQDQNRGELPHDPCRSQAGWADETAFYPRPHPCASSGRFWLTTGFPAVGRAGGLLRHHRRS